MILRSCLLFYLCAFVIVEGFGGLTRVGGSLNGLKVPSGSKKTVNKVLGAEEPNQGVSGGDKSNRSKSRSFLSAWGIISVIMLVIVGSLLVYYVSIFYPLVCAKQGKYHVMEMTPL